MKVAIGVLMIALGCVYSDIAGECDMAGFYLELGCTPNPNPDNSTTCPESFTCPDLHPDPEKCYYRGVSYSDKAMLPQNLINNPCSKACSCQVSDEPQFECAAVDCVETFDSDLEQQCIYTYELDDCCSSGRVCGKDAIAALATCEVDGQTYKEGQMFEPKNTRKSCICTKDWKGTVDDSYCKDINCGIEIHYQKNILDTCAPIFVGNMKSCPIGFECSSPTSKTIRGVNIRSISSQCVFGNQTMAVGDEVTVEEKCMSCACEVPPFVSCMKKNSCKH